MKSSTGSTSLKLSVAEENLQIYGQYSFLFSQKKVKNLFCFRFRDLIHKPFHFMQKSKYQKVIISDVNDSQ